MPALTKLVAQLPASLPAAVLVVQHLAPESTGQPLVARLAEHTKLCCQLASDQVPLRPGHLYLAPPDRHLPRMAGLAMIPLIRGLFLIVDFRHACAETFRFRLYNDTAGRPVHFDLRTDGGRVRFPDFEGRPVAGTYVLTVVDDVPGCRGMLMSARLLIERSP